MNLPGVLAHVPVPRWAGGLRALAATVGLVAALAPRAARAQGEVVGRVLADSGRTPVRGATLGIARPARSVTTDSLGRFRLADVPPGDHVLVVRAAGFEEERLEFFVESNESVFKDVALVRAAQRLAGATILAEAPATGSARMAAFRERQALGIGHFVTREQLADAEGGRRSTGSLLSMAPGVSVRQVTSRAWVASMRAVNTQGGGCAFCRPKPLAPVDQAAGARPACYMDVYVDGVLVFNSAQPEGGLFDVNSIPPDHLEGIEVYTSAAQVPSQYNRTNGGCGVLLLWTRS